MTDLPALLDESTDHTATTCLACGATRQIGHLPNCPARHPDATDLLVEPLNADSSRTWLISGLRHNLTPARRRRFAEQIPLLHWVRPVDQPSLPFSTGALINEIVPQMGIGRHVAAIGYNALATVPVTDCGCTDVWRCRCDFEGHRFRFADADLWPDYSLLGLKVRYQTSWSHMWLLDNGRGAIWVAEDVTPIPAASSPITRRCYLRWCDTCPGQAKTGPDALPAPCTCPCHHEGDLAVNTELAQDPPAATAVERSEPPRSDAQQTAHAYQAYVACFTDATQALLHLSHTAGIAVAYMDRGCIEAERGGPLTDEQWEELTYQLDEYDDHVSFDDTNSLFLDQIFADANIPRHPDDEDDAEQDEDDLNDDLDDDESVTAQ